MGRRWIMVELGEHCHTHIVPRLKKVIDGQDPAASPRRSTGAAAAVSAITGWPRRC
jgi:adenine specific DNA methylase Mod